MNLPDSTANRSRSPRAACGHRTHSLCMSLMTVVTDSLSVSPRTSHAEPYIVAHDPSRIARPSRAASSPSRLFFFACLSCLFVFPGAGHRSFSFQRDVQAEALPLFTCLPLPVRRS